MSSVTATRGRGCSPVAASVYSATFGSEWGAAAPMLCTTVCVPRWSAGWETGRRGDLLPQGLQVPACSFTSGGSRASPNLRGAQGCLCHLLVAGRRWLVRADLLFLGRSPFPSCLLLAGVAQLPQAWLQRTMPERDGESCLRRARKSFVPIKWWGEPWQGTAGRMQRDLPKAEECQGHLATPPPGCLQYA